MGASLPNHVGNSILTGAVGTKPEGKGEHVAGRERVKLPVGDPFPDKSVRLLLLKTF